MSHLQLLVVGIVEAVELLPLAVGDVGFGGVGGLEGGVGGGGGDGRGGQGQLDLLAVAGGGGRRPGRREGRGAVQVADEVTNSRRLLMPASGPVLCGSCLRLRLHSRDRSSAQPTQTPAASSTSTPSSTMYMLTPPPAGPDMAPGREMTERGREGRKERRGEGRGGREGRG